MKLCLIWQIQPFPLQHVSAPLGIRNVGNSCYGAGEEQGRRDREVMEGGAAEEEEAVAVGGSCSRGGLSEKIRRWRARMSMDL